MHELVHLDYTVQARRKGTNFLFVSTKEHKETFIRDNEPIIRKLNRDGVSDRSIADFITSLFNGMNSQIGNAPVDLFIEDFLFNTYPNSTSGPVHFPAIVAKRIHRSAGNKQIIKYSPVIVRSANLILNLVHCLQFRDLFGYNLFPFFKTTAQEMKRAKGFYNEYLSYQKNNQSLEAYKLIQRWAEELRIDKYFTFIEEKEYQTTPLFSPLTKRRLKTSIPHPLWERGRVMRNPLTKNLRLMRMQKNH